MHFHPARFLPSRDRRLAPSPFLLCLRIAGSHKQLCQQPGRLQQFVPQPPQASMKDRAPASGAACWEGLTPPENLCRVEGSCVSKWTGQDGTGSGRDPKSAWGLHGAVGAMSLLRTTLLRPSAVGRRRRGDEFDLQPLCSQGHHGHHREGCSHPSPPCASARLRGTGARGHPVTLLGTQSHFVPRQPHCSTGSQPLSQSGTMKNNCKKKEHCKNWSGGKSCVIKC